MDKAKLRSILKKKREQLNDETRIMEEKKAYQHIFLSKEYQRAEHILCYSSYGSEFNTMPIIKKAWEDGKKVYLPRVLGKHEMEFYNICDLSDLESGAYGIMEPKRFLSEYLFLPDETSVMFLPGLGFDKRMNRIGYGMGFYDTYIEKIQQMDGYSKESFLTCGLCYDCQLIDEVITDERDKKLDAIVAGKEVIFTNNRENGIL